MPVAPAKFTAKLICCIEPAQLTAANELAARQGTSLAAIVREALSKHLMAQARTEKRGLAKSVRFGKEFIKTKPQAVEPVPGEEQANAATAGGKE